MTKYLQLLRAFVEQLRATYQRLPHRTQLAEAAGAVLVVVLAWLIFRNKKPSPEEMERRRRERLAGMGRITDGFLVDARSLDGEESMSPTPEVLVYSYRLAGVTYNCAQDVSLLPERVKGYRLDQPLQVRYDPRNPGDSIVVAESWTGLWNQRPSIIRPRRHASSGVE